MQSSTWKASTVSIPVRIVLCYVTLTCVAAAPCQHAAHVLLPLLPAQFVALLQHMDVVPLKYFPEIAAWWSHPLDSSPDTSLWAVRCVGRAADSAPRRDSQSLPIYECNNS
jgi:hypothetical protein